jgi:2-oxoglutarate dehydrogenase E2 component (dihydrolipoamide succinyltransferase)
VASNIVVPQLGESVVEARVARWLKKEGDAVAAGEPVVELETEKIDLEVGAEHTGVLAKIARPEGDDVKVGEVLGTIEEGQAAAAGAAATSTASMSRPSMMTFQPSCTSAAASARPNPREPPVMIAVVMAAPYDLKFTSSQGGRDGSFDW